MGDTEGLTATQKEARRNLVTSLVAGIASQGGNISTAVTAAVIETENNALSLRGSAQLLNTMRKCGDGNAACDITSLRAEMERDSKKQNERVQEACSGPSANLSQCMAIANNAQQSAINLVNASIYADTPEKRALIAELAQQQVQDMQAMQALVDKATANPTFQDALNAVIVGGIEGAMLAGVRVKKKEETTAKLPSKAESFEKGLVNLPPGERVAVVKVEAKKVADTNGWEKDNQLSRINGRDVYRAPDGSLYSVDTQHGRFEKVDGKTGSHQGEFRLHDLTFIKDSIDNSGRHDLRVK
jgi:hypothetical protein